MYKRLSICLTAALLIAAPILGQTNEAEGLPGDGSQQPTTEPIKGPADRILASLSDAQLRALVEETLARSPDAARALNRARAADRSSLQAGVLPDPMVGATAWLLSPETRTGPQLLTLSWTQDLPWLSRLDLREQAAVLEANARYLDVEAIRLDLVTTVRKLYYELAFLVRHREITLDFLDHLQNHQEISQSRYATGIGSSQDVIKIQADITMAEKLLLELDQRRIELEAEINRLRDRSSSAVILPAVLPIGTEVSLDIGGIRLAAQQSRPEVASLDARIAAGAARIKVAEKEYRPNFKVGLTYTFVDRRDDAAGIAMPPQDNGRDILGLQGSVSVPIWRQKLKAGVEEATEMDLSVREEKRAVLADLEAAIDDLARRIPLTWQQLRLLEDILIIQAEESVRSAQSSYVAGTFNALDLLDAEHVLFDAETAIARTRADYAIRLAQLEGVVGEPLTQKEKTEQSDS